jgi:hypothetical protein
MNAFVTEISGPSKRKHFLIGIVNTNTRQNTPQLPNIHIKCDAAFQELYSLHLASVIVSFHKKKQTHFCCESRPARFSGAMPFGKQVWDHKGNAEK